MDRYHIGFLMNRQFKADFLVAQPSALSGIARILDLYGVFDDYNHSSTEREADLRATYVDWQIVGDDLRNALRSAGEQKLVQDDRQLELALR
jgi:hypothetical protein